MPIRFLARKVSGYTFCVQRLFPICAFAILMVFANQSFALKDTAIGRFDVGASLSAEYDSRVFGVSSQMYNSIKNSAATTSYIAAGGASIYAPNEIESEDDLILRFTPAIHYTNKLRWFTFSGTAGVQIAQYVKNTKKSYVQPMTSFNIDFDETLSKRKRISNNAKIRFDMTFDLGQKVETSMLEQDLVTYSFFLVGANVRYNHSKKFGVGAGTSWNYRNYQSNASATGGQNAAPYQDMATLPVYARAFYIYSEKLDFFTEYNYSKTRSMSGDSNSSLLDSATHGVNLGAQGQLSPKLSGSANIGYVRQVYDFGFPGQGSLSLGSGLQWTLNRKTSIGFDLSRGFTPSPQGYTMLNTTGRLSLNHRFTDDVSGTTYLSYGTAEYTYADNAVSGTPSGTRSSTMDNFGFGASLSKKINKYFDMSGGYNFSYFDRGKPTGGGETYGRHVVKVDLNGRF